MTDLVDDRTVKSVRAITARVYSEVCTKMDYSVENLRIEVLNDDITLEEFNDKKEALDVEYCKHIVKLSSSCLEDIIKIHKSGQLLRAQKTIDAIMTELLERELYGESKSRTTKNSKTK